MYIFFVIKNGSGPFASNISRVKTLPPVTAYFKLSLVSLNIFIPRGNKDTLATGAAADFDLEPGDFAL